MATKRTMELTVEEEFAIVTGIVLNNWFALQISDGSIPDKIGINESNKPQHAVHSMVQKVYDTAYNAIMSLKKCLCSWDDAAEELQTCMDREMDVVLEDDSHMAVLSELNDFYNLIGDNDRELLRSRLSRLGTQKHIITGEIYDFSKIDVIRIGTDPAKTVFNLPPSTHSVQPDDGTPTPSSVPSDPPKSEEMETDDVGLRRLQWDSANPPSPSDSSQPPPSGTEEVASHSPSTSDLKTDKTTMRKRNSVQLGQQEEEWNIVSRRRRRGKE